MKKRKVKKTKIVASDFGLPEKEKPEFEKFDGYGFLFAVKENIRNRPIDGHMAEYICRWRI